jgi:hypothetical protein
MLDQIAHSPAYEEDFEPALARYKSVVENENILNNHKLIGRETCVCYPLGNY